MFSFNSPQGILGLLCGACYLATTCCSVSAHINLSRAKRQNSINPAIMSRLRNIRTFAELQQNFNLHTDSDVAVLSAHDGGSADLEPFITHEYDPSKLLPLKANPQQATCTVISAPHSIGDSCKLVDECIPVPIKQQRHTIFTFPPCVELPRCNGHCCELYHGCKATEERVFVNVTILDWTEGDNFNYLGWQLVEMKKHTACSCSTCASMPTCGNGQRLENCRCVAGESNEEGNSEAKERRTQYFELLS